MLVEPEALVVTVTVVVTGVATVEMEGLLVIITVRTLPVFEVMKTVAVFDAVTVSVMVTVVSLAISKKALKVTHPLPGLGRPVVKVNKQRRKAII